MSRDIHRAAERRLRSLADDAAEGVESTLLHNRVHETVAGQHSTDDPLAALLDASERAYAIEARNDVSDDPVGNLAFDAGETLHEGVDALVDAQIARACATVIQEGDDWTDAWDAAAIAAAKREARDWMQAHIEVCDRLGLVEVVQCR